MKATELENFPIKYYDTKSQLARFIYNRSDEAFLAGDKARDSIESREQLEERKSLIREKLLEAIGGLPSSDTALNARITGTVECDGFKIEKIIYEPRPNTYVTSNLYLPDGIVSPRGAVLFLCGHYEESKHHDEYQTVCQYLVRSGLIVFAIDPIGQGERLSYYNPSSKKATVRWGIKEHDYAGSQCWPLGDGLARYFLHDVMRAIDYLCSRPEVDPNRIGATGNSGGGTQTALLMLCDSRIAAFAPATNITNRQTYMYAGQAQDAEQIWPGMTAAGFDHEDILLAAAPKPVLVLAVKYDFFPIEGTRRTVKRTKRFWSMYGKEDHLELFEDDSRHLYTKRLAEKAAQFFAKHLLGKSSCGVAEELIKPLEHSKLWCTISGQVRGDFENAHFVFEDNLARLAELADKHNAVPDQERKQKSLLWLKDRIFHNRRPCDPNPRFWPMGQMDDLMVESSAWWSQEGILNHAFLFRKSEYTGMDLRLTIAVWEGGTSELQAHMEWLLETCSARRAVLVLNVSGVGTLFPHTFNSNLDSLDFYGVIHKLTTDLIWLDDSLAAMRAYDVTRAVDIVGKIPFVDESDLQFYTHGRQGVYVKLASAVDERIKSVRAINEIKNMKDWVGAKHYNHYDIMSLVLPGMLKHFDLQDLNRWLNHQPM